jgi:hypothetical protein
MTKNSSTFPRGRLPAAIAQSPHVERVAAIVDDLWDFAAGKLGIPVEKIVVEIEVNEAVTRLRRR